MIGAILGGATGGCGLFLLGFAMVPRRLSLARQIAALDAPFKPGNRSSLPADDEGMSEFSRKTGAMLAKFCAERGWEFPSLRSSLSLAGKSFENYLATKVLLGFFGLLITPVLFFL